MQIHAPGTTNHKQNLVNSYISEVDLVSAGEILDLEMAVNLG